MNASITEIARGVLIVNVVFTLTSNELLVVNHVFEGIANRNNAHHLFARVPSCRIIARLIIVTVPTV